MDGKVKGKERDPVILLLAQSIKKYLDAFPVFKAITGEAFEKDHWKILFGLLKTPKEVNEENLKVKQACWLNQRRVGSVRK